LLPRQISENAPGEKETLCDASNRQDCHQLLFFAKLSLKQKKRLLLNSLNEIFFALRKKQKNIQIRFDF
jgi:hypothetical protein